MTTPAPLFASEKGLSQSVSLTATVAVSSVVRGQIIAVLNREFGFVRAVCSLDNHLVQEREQLVDTLHALYQLTAEGDGFPPVSDADIVDAATTLKRLQLFGHGNHAALLAFCRRESTVRSTELMHADPLQRRHLLCYVSERLRTSEFSVRVQKLERILELDCEESLNLWFEELYKNAALLPKDLPYLLRSSFLKHADSQRACLPAFVHRMVVLDVLMTGALGWENSRSFLAMMHKLGGETCAYLKVYLEGEAMKQEVFNADWRRLVAPLGVPVPASTPSVHKKGGSLGWLSSLGFSKTLARLRGESYAS